MKYVYRVFILIFYTTIFLSLHAEVPLIPYPKNISDLGVDVVVPKNLQISSEKVFYEELEYLKRELSEDYNFTLENNVSSSFNLKLIYNNTCKRDGYILSVNPSEIVLQANDKGGMFYAIQTLRQLISKNNKNQIIVPTIEISDYPEFEWRAFMLDEARNFQGIDVVKNLLDEMSLLKMNVFHWHLTDDQGWRIEIKKYPLLTEVGGRRDSTQLNWYDTDIYDKNPSAGYYTQEQIKEIVLYAKERNIMIVPEIDMPGHMSAAIAAYPWLGSNNQPIKVPTSFGVKHNVLDVSNARVIDFVKDVVDELSDLFPSRVFHIGGDEVRPDQWMESESIKEYMNQNKIESYGELHLDFIKNVSSAIASKNKRMMGWNDITGDKLHHFQQDVETNYESDLPSNTIVQFWLGDDFLIKKTAEAGYDIVNAYHEFTYLDYNHDKITPGKEYSFSPISLEKAYSFSPIPKSFPIELHEKIIGVSCQMWGEWVPTVSNLNNRVFPYIAAHAETGWTKPSQKSFDRFSHSLKYFRKRWHKKGYLKQCDKKSN